MERLPPAAGFIKEVAAAAAIVTAAWVSGKAMENNTPIAQSERRQELLQQVLNDSVDALHFAIYGKAPLPYEREEFINGLIKESSSQEFKSTEEKDVLEVRNDLVATENAERELQQKRALLIFLAALLASGGYAASKLTQRVAGTLATPVTMLLEVIRPKDAIEEAYRKYYGMGVGDNPFGNTKLGNPNHMEEMLKREGASRSEVR